MLSLTAAEIEERAKHVIEQLALTDLQLALEPGESAIGGGAAPTSSIKSVLIALSHPRKSPSDLELQLRRSTPPVVARVAENKVLLDLRTVLPEDLAALVLTLQSLN
jgi:L-seryl-tRNA(Ser) seleniumtransferase